jgi:hypothetical protein
MQCFNGKSYGALGARQLKDAIQPLSGSLLGGVVSPAREQRRRLWAHTAGKLLFKLE